MPPLALLAGGLATRLRPLTETCPKSLIEIAGEPFIFHQLRLFKNQGVEKIIICAGYLAEMIQDAVGDGSSFGLSVAYSIDGPTLLGTGGAISRALPLLGNEFLIMYGDSYLPIDFCPVVTAFRQSKRLAMMTVFQNQGQWDSSNMVFESGEIKVYDKKNKTPQMHHIDYGLGVAQAEAFKNIPNDLAYDLADLYQDLLKRSQLAGFEVQQRFYEIGSVEGIAETNQLLQKTTLL